MIFSYSIKFYDDTKWHSPGSILLRNRPLKHFNQGHPVPNKSKNAKIEFYNLKSNNICAFLLMGACKRGVYTLQTGDSKTASYYNISRTYFLQASNQKTPALNEKSRAVRMCLNEFEAHSVCMLFSGAGVPLIGMFQGVAFFTIE